MIRYSRNDSYVERTIMGKNFLVPFRRNSNGLRIFELPYIGLLVWKEIECFTEIDEIRSYILGKCNGVKINDMELKAFLETLIKYELVYEVRE